MIGNGIRVHHHVETVDSADQAVSLAEYLSQHGILAFKETNDSVMIAVEAPNKDHAGDAEKMIYMLVTTWMMFWEHSDKGLFGLPIYVKD